MPTKFNNSTIFFPEFDSAFLGLGKRTGDPYPIAVYDRSVCVSILVDRDGLSWEEANEWVAHNTESAWTGLSTPLLLDIMPIKKAKESGEEHNNIHYFPEKNKP